jgi:hypothetical protein
VKAERDDKKMHGRKEVANQPVLFNSIQSVVSP